MKMRFSSLALLCLCLAGSCQVVPLGLASTPLSGSVQYEQFMGGGNVFSARTGQRIGDAWVTIPQIGYQVQTNSDGQFQLPPLPDKAVIIQIQKPGFAPETRTLKGPPGQLLQVGLREARQMVLIDSQLHHLGDNQYAAASAGAAQFQRQADGPTLQIPFYMPQTPASEEVTLQIGSVVGLDTARAQQHNQSHLAYSSGPSIIRINGVEVALLTLNGDRQRVMVPAQTLHPGAMNMIQIEAGYHTPGGTRIDYDDFELMAIRLEI